ncbi:MAG: alpha/beta hydrolase [Terriglobia bacterium]
MLRDKLLCLAILFTLSKAFGSDPDIRFAKATYTYKTVGGHAIKADVYRPPDNRVRPVILFLHGGALIFGDRTNIRNAQLGRYLKEGFVVVSIDYRLAPETKLPEIIADVQDAYAWVRSAGREFFRANPNRIAVVGHSAGGYLTLSAGYQCNPPPRALVSFYGYGDIVGPWYSRPDPFYLKEPAVSLEKARLSVGNEIVSEGAEESRWFFYLYCRQQGLWPKMVGGWDPDTEPRKFDLYCPVRNVTAKFPPTLLLHGDADTDVPFEQSELMARELKRHRVEHRLIRIQGGPHGFDRNADDPQAAQAFEAVIAFLKKHLK